MNHSTNFFLAKTDQQLCIVINIASFLPTTTIDFLACLIKFWKENKALVLQKTFLNHFILSSNTAIIANQTKTLILRE